MHSYSDTLFARLRSRGWNVHIFAYVDRDNRRLFCADAQRGDGVPFIARGESMLAALLELDYRCQSAEGAMDRSTPPEPSGLRPSPAQSN